MKIITIGRGDEADIQLNQAEISRRHANIRFGRFGKMEIRDLSTNGTSINGRTLPPNKFVPVSRKDVVSFANVAKLDWKEVPDPMKPYRIGAIVIAAIIVVAVVIGIINNIDFKSFNKPAAQQAVEQDDGMPREIEQPSQTDNENSVDDNSDLNLDELGTIMDKTPEKTGKAPASKKKPDTKKKEDPKPEPAKENAQPEPRGAGGLL